MITAPPIIPIEPSATIPPAIVNAPPIIETIFPFFDCSDIEITSPIFLLTEEPFVIFIFLPLLVP